MRYSLLARPICIGFISMLKQIPCSSRLSPLKISAPSLLISDSAHSRNEGGEEGASLEILEFFWNSGAISGLVAVLAPVSVHRS